MEGELKKIKKIYGEEFAKLCRSLFPVVLEQEGLLLEILTKNFAPTRSLCEAIKESEDKLTEFKYFIFCQAGIKRVAPKYIEETPEQLMAKAGYKLYRCETDEDVKSFMKYYREDELLCTFHDPDRINKCHIFFAVREDAETLNREDFTDPKRQDPYGTSVISLQFTKDDGELSIKNRYNHSVDNPDNTFSNELDNIIPGLYDSFATHYGLESVVDYRYYDTIELKGFTRARDGKMYKFTQRVREAGTTTFFCENNIMIRGGEVTQFDRARYELVENFLIDKSEKKITNLSLKEDTFVEEFKDVEKIDIEKGDGGSRKIIVTRKDGSHFTVTVNGSNAIIGYENNFQKEVKTNFLIDNKELKTLRMDNVEKIGENFLKANKKLETLALPKVKKIGDFCLHRNNHLKHVEMPELEELGRGFATTAVQLEELSLPKLRFVGSGLLTYNRKLKKLDLPELVEVPDDFLYENIGLTSVSLPKVESVGSNFLGANKILSHIEMQNVVYVGRNFLRSNEQLQRISLPKAVTIGSCFLKSNVILSEVDLPEVRNIGGYFLSSNNGVESLSLPHVESITSNFMEDNRVLKELNMPELEDVRDDFLLTNNSLETVNLPKLKIVEDNFLKHNCVLKNVSIPNLQSTGLFFLASITEEAYLELPMSHIFSEKIRQMLQNQATREKK